MQVILCHDLNMFSMFSSSSGTLKLLLLLLRFGLLAVLYHFKQLTKQSNPRVQLTESYHRKSDMVDDICISTTARQKFSADEDHAIGSKAPAELQ